MIDIPQRLVLLRKRFFAWVNHFSFCVVDWTIVPDGVGGRTVFPEDDFANTPVEGSALLYRSKEELLHYSEAMTGSHEKWVMQLLLDYNHNYQPGDTITCFRTGTSYVWDGQEG